MEEAAGAVSNTADEAVIEGLRGDLRRMMWRDAGLLREEATLREGLPELEAIEASVTVLDRSGVQGSGVLELRSLVTVARAILVSAIARTESRGAHFREDYPKRDDAEFQKHSVFVDGAVRFERW